MILTVCIPFYLYNRTALETVLVWTAKKREISAWL